MYYAQRLELTSLLCFGASSSNSGQSDLLEWLHGTAAFMYAREQFLQPILVIAT